MRTTYTRSLLVVVALLAGAGAALAVAGPQSTPSNAPIPTVATSTTVPLPALDRLIARLATEARTHRKSF